jgi:hypothetical protein
MSGTQIPAPDPGERPGEFDAMCSEVEDFELLPTVAPAPAPPAADPGEDERTAPLDELILAGLVSP